MKKLFGVLFLLVSAIVAKAQFELNELGHLRYDTLHGSGINDIWGYVDEFGNEYALLGVDVGGVSVVDVTDPANPTEVFFAPGLSSTWRDVKVWNDFAYITTEAGGGLTVIDLNPLPQSTNLQTTDTWLWAQGTAHNLQIDENGLCYVFGTGSNLTLIYDLNADPWNPPIVGSIPSGYVHDGFIRGDTVYLAQIYDGEFTVWDVADLANPVLLGSQATPADFCHNVWVSDDGNYAFTTDEVDGAAVVSWDISDLSDITELDQFYSYHNGNAAPHNVFFKDGYLFTSYYRDGLVVFDATYPENVVKVGEFDSSPLTDGGFDGAWGVYPYFPSGNIIVSDREEGLFALEALPQRGCYLSGTVTDVQTLAPINDVYVEILGASAIDETEIAGEYAVGTAGAGNYDVLFYKPQYEPDTAFGITLTNGVETVLNRQLIPKETFTLTGFTRETDTGDTIPGVQIRFEGLAWQFEVTSGANGSYAIPEFVVGDYDVFAGDWGYTSTCYYAINYDGTDTTFNVYMQKGYYDDFTMDLGWNIQGGSASGQFERAEPIGLNVGPSVYSPDGDFQYDCDGNAFITGQSPDEVLNGTAVIISPVAVMWDYSDPWVNMHYFVFHSDEDTVSPAPFYRVRLRDGGTNSAVVMDEELTDPWTGTNGWAFKSFRINDYLPNPNYIYIDVLAKNIVSPGGRPDYFKFAVDKFWISEGPVSTEELTSDSNEDQPQMLAFPNPASHEVNLQITPPLQNSAQIIVFDLQGRVVQRIAIAPHQSNIQLSSSLTSGMYLIKIEGADRVYPTVRLLKE